MSYRNKIVFNIYPDTVPYDPTVNYYVYVDNMNLPMKDGILTNGFFFNIQPEHYVKSNNQNNRWLLWKQRTVHPDQLPLF